jgi:hypothetical protein
MAWQEPKTDWVANPKSPMSEDFNRIESNIDFLKGDIETKKGAIVAALNTVGLASELTDTHATLASKITSANQGTKIITPGTTNQTIAKGFHSGQGYVKGDANLKTTNIRKGINIFGLIGSVQEGALTASGTLSITSHTATVTGVSFAPNYAFLYGQKVSYVYYVAVLTPSVTAYGQRYEGTSSGHYSYYGTGSSLTTNGFSFSFNYDPYAGATTCNWVCLRV